jgi:myo-inositol-1(or 4)-monophosphatase
LANNPLDGTGEYVEGENPNELTYGFGLAKQYEGTLELGLFFNPSKNELFTAASGLGAFLNDRSIHVSEQHLHQAWLTTTHIGKAHSLMLVFMM